MAAAGSASPLPNAYLSREALWRDRLSAGSLSLFLDYDGTLTPIVNDPEKALLSAEARDALRHLACQLPVAVVSGRSCDKLGAFLQVAELPIAGSHGLDIRLPGPPARSMLHPVGEAAREALLRVQKLLDAALNDIPGYLTEDNVLCVSAHYRMVQPELQPRVHEAVAAVLKTEPELQHKTGKMVHELRPAVDWDKGRAVQWLLESFAGARDAGDGAPALLPVYIGDDVADEDAFRFVESVGGVGIKVADEPVTAEQTCASWQVEQAQVLPLLRSFV